MQWIARGALMAFCSFGLITAARAIHVPPATVLERPVIANGAVPENVERILVRSCRDCHSNNTVWPWYSHVFPMSRMIAADVNEGRAFLNLSNWNSYSRARKLGYLASIANAAAAREMPPARYSLIHSDARLSETDRHALADWAKWESIRLRSAQR